eukprot:CAMPEP_0180353744 /NCGR_PEP_ID=MMETSP0989-20121125/7810_1 /TAXON_ID=697907 /ORGANISM="non described non described, Strain CCMP2293" /LENGTH=60 /DNA_ID=CAMNT_0022343443 /DNA_START=805 /DNA_END=983 /DNA_ORIENTATION=+
MKKVWEESPAGANAGSVSIISPKSECERRPMPISGHGWFSAISTRSTAMHVSPSWGSLPA